MSKKKIKKKLKDHQCNSVRNQKQTSKANIYPQPRKRADNLFRSVEEPVRVGVVAVVGFAGGREGRERGVASPADCRTRMSRPTNARPHQPGLALGYLSADRY